MLRLGVLTSDREDFRRAATCLARLDAGRGDGDVDLSSPISVGAFADSDPRSFSLVIGIGSHTQDEGALVDVWLPSDGSLALDASLSALWHDRIVPFDDNLRRGVRAPRVRRPVIVDSDPSWPDQASRLIGRLDLALSHLAHRIDHIGSTSVPGLAAKDLIDIQVVVADLDAAAAAAIASASAGFVHVPGAWFGPGNEGRDQPEEVCVDADPGRPVNVNLRPLASPVWRDALLLRDWLRQSADGRAEYVALKRSLADRGDLDIDAYGEAKASWISSSLLRAAERPRSGTNWPSTNQS